MLLFAARSVVYPFIKNRRFALRAVSHKQNVKTWAEVKRESQSSPGLLNNYSSAIPSSEFFFSSFSFIVRKFRIPYNGRERRQKRDLENGAGRQVSLSG